MYCIRKTEKDFAKHSHSRKIVSCGWVPSYLFVGNQPVSLIMLVACTLLQVAHNSIDEQKAGIKYSTTNQ